MILRYYNSLGTSVDGLKEALSKVKDFSSVEVDAQFSAIKVFFNGKCDRLAEVEEAVKNAGATAIIVNHVEIQVALIPQKGAEADYLRQRLQAAPGVLSVDVKPTSVILHGDLTFLTTEGLREAAASANYEIFLNQSHEFLTYKVVEGRAGDYAGKVRNVRGVMHVVEKPGGIVGMWINRACFKKPVKKGERPALTLLLGPIEKIEGFVVEKPE